MSKPKQSNCQHVIREARRAVKGRVNHLDLPTRCTSLGSSSTRGQVGLYIFPGASPALCGAKCGRRILRGQHLVIDDSIGQHNRSGCSHRLTETRDGSSSLVRGGINAASWDTGPGTRLGRELVST